MNKIRKRALLFDLDNTLYPVSSIGNDLFAELYNLIESDKRYSGDLEEIKAEIQKRPFQVVANEHKFHPDLIENSLRLLENLVYTGPIKPFASYEKTKELDVLKFLITTGFTKLQWSKIKGMNIEKDFEKCFVVDPSKSSLTKKDVFAQIMKEYSLTPEETLVVGDDVHSEIAAAKALGMDTVLYDYTGKYTKEGSYDGPILLNYDSLAKYLQQSLAGRLSLILAFALTFLR